MKDHCDFCYRPYTPGPNVRYQLYCKRSDCIKKRKRQGQRNKRGADKDYIENQSRAYKSWAQEHPDYWKNYRANHPRYVKKNRENQRKRNAKRKMLKEVPDFVKAEIAKMEGSKKKIYLKSGYYILTPFRNKNIAKVEKLVVKIDIFSRS